MCLAGCVRIPSLELPTQWIRVWGGVAGDGDVVGRLSYIAFCHLQISPLGEGVNVEVASSYEGVLQERHFYMQLQSNM